MQLHHRRAQGFRCIELFAVGFDEHGDANTGRNKLRHDGLKAGRLGGNRCRPRWCVPRAFPARCRRHGAGASARWPASLRSRPFPEFSGMASLAFSAAISLSRMWRRSSRRWAVMPSAPASCASMCGAHRIGIVAAPRIAHGGNVIDVDAEAQGHGAIITAKGGYKHYRHSGPYIAEQIASDDRDHGEKWHQQADDQRPSKAQPTRRARATSAKNQLSAEQAGRRRWAGRPPSAKPAQSHSRKACWR